MEDNTQNLQEEIKNTKFEDVDQHFILKLAKWIGEVERRVGNIEATNETEKEITALAPTIPPMSRVISKPNIDIEVNFPNTFTYSNIKDQGLKFQQELEILFDKYQVQSMNITYQREIRG